MFQDEETTVEVATTGSIQEQLTKDDDMLILTSSAKSDYRVTIEPSVMLLLLGVYITCECSYIILNTTI